MKLTLGIMVGAESKEWLADLTKQIDRLEKMQAENTVTTAGAVDTVEVEADEDFAPKKPAKKSAAAKAFEEEAEEEETEESEETEEEEEEGFTAKVTKVGKAGKPKKLTLDDVNDACKGRAAATGGKKGRGEVLAILKKKFGTESVSELKPEQYAACVAAMGA